MSEFKLNETQLANFWSNVNGNGASIPGMKTKCWEWEGAKSKGYGQFRVNGKKLYSHRISWILKNGEIPNDKSYHGICVLHKCDNPACVNHQHLFLGTASDNMQDKVLKGRQASVKGELHGRSLLTTEQVLKIRKLGKLKYPLRRIAMLFPAVSEATISRIINRKIWRHLPETPCKTTSTT